MRPGLIVAGGPVSVTQLETEVAKGPELIIAADSGGKYLLDLGVLPDLLVGDFDSLAPEELRRMEAAGVKKENFPSQKDETDLELSLEYAWRGGITDLTILGGLGGSRLDHTLANIGLLLAAQRRGISARLIDPAREVMLVGAKRVFPYRPGWALSLIPLTAEVRGINTRGLAYPLRNETLYFGSGRGVHNRFELPEAVVEVGEGILLAIGFRED
jgi:thiamine pyrophosphokinase